MTKRLNRIKPGREFTEGAKVVCVNNGEVSWNDTVLSPERHLIVGNTYTIRKTSGNCIWLAELEGVCGGLVKPRFKLI
jgi:hypothetical protein